METEKLSNNSLERDETDNNVFGGGPTESAKAESTPFEKIEFNLEEKRKIKKSATVQLKMKKSMSKGITKEFNEKNEEPESKYNI